MDTCHSADSTAPCIHLVSLPQLAEATSKEDDWTGTTDAAARRRAQTRLNTRAYRRRKALAKKVEAETPVKAELLIECWDHYEQSVSVIPASRMKTRHPLLSEKERHSIIFPLSPDHLIILLQYNAIRALAVNRSLITGILVTVPKCNEDTIHTIPYPTKPNLLPSALLPTILQQTVPHGDWIDMWPIPEGRDRLIQAAGTFDEDDLWADCIGGLYEGYPDDEMERRGVIAWSPPWDIAGWEMSEGFVRKWGWLFRGLPGMLDATNRWREKRGEEALTLD